jgi:hypothetical protein
MSVNVMDLCGASPDAVLVKPDGRIVAVVEAKARVPFVVRQEGEGTMPHARS